MEVIVMLHSNTCMSCVFHALGNTSIRNDNKLHSRMHSLTCQNFHACLIHSWLGEPNFIADVLLILDNIQESEKI